jgi:hypothetical protein
MRHAAAPAIANDYEPGLGIFSVCLSNLAPEPPPIIQLAEVGLGKANLLEVVARPGQVPDIQWVQPVDQHDMHMVAAILRNRAARLEAVGVWRAHRVQEGKATARSGQC